MELPIGTVMSRLARAKAWLRGRLLQPAAAAEGAPTGGRPMDCKTARLLLDYARPNNRELDAAETRALEDHLGRLRRLRPAGPRRTPGRRGHRPGHAPGGRARPAARPHPGPAEGGARRPPPALGRLRPAQPSPPRRPCCCSSWACGTGTPIRPAFRRGKAADRKPTTRISPRRPKRWNATLERPGRRDGGAGPELQLSALVVPDQRRRPSDADAGLQQPRRPSRRRWCSSLPDTQFDVNALPAQPATQGRGRTNTSARSRAPGRRPLRPTSSTTRATTWTG